VPRAALGALAAALAGAGAADRARAQPAPDPVLTTAFDPAQCDAPAAPPPASPAEVAAPVTWSDFDISGALVDRAATVRELLAPALRRHRALTGDARVDIARAAAAVGYHLVGLGTREAPGGTRAAVHLAPLPIIRRIEVTVQQSVFAALLDDEIRRRMGVRVAAYLPWDPTERGCKLLEEARNIDKFLQDEGYLDARARIVQRLSREAVTLDVQIALGPAYSVDLRRVQIVGAAGLPIDAATIRERFRHRGTCFFGDWICFGRPRFTRARHNSDLQQVAAMFRALGYPAVRVRSDYSPEVSIDRRTQTVRFAVTIDPRRRLDIQFEGYIPGTVTVEQLRRQLTFEEASSTDDVEAEESARALGAYLQGRGFFDARVTWNRERFALLDRVIFRIEQGASRQVRTVSFTGDPRAFTFGELTDAIATKPARLSTSLFGGSAATTSAQLAADVERLRQLYRSSGYRSARVTVAAATDPAGLESAALAAALLARGGGLHVRFTIDEGPRTYLREVRVELGDRGDAVGTAEERALCRTVLTALAELHGQPTLATPLAPGRCAATAPADLPYREGAVAETPDRLRDRLFNLGRPRATVEYEEVALGPTAVAARYRLRNLQELRVGTLVIRGNFRTRDWIIRRELRLRRGAPLTSDLLADGARRLRNTGLFDAATISLLDLDRATAGAVNALVAITERYGRAQLELEAGYSTFNGAFLKATPSLRNLAGLGLALDVTGTVGFDAGTLIDQGSVQLRQLAAEATLRVPHWLLSPLGFQAEITAFHRRQDTPRFGVLRTTGITTALSRTWERPRSAQRAARAITAGLHYDFRIRERNIDVVRSIGADADESQVPIRTRTGAVGATFEWEQRGDRRGTLSPLAPESGFRFDGQVALAAPYFGGQDTFIKLSVAGSKYWAVTEHLVLRADLRYDQGFPLDGEQLLPEVERFFAGGDATVRGYEDDRLATEIIRIGVPPLDNVTQFRVLPAGGNIRALGSLDAQVRIYKFLASALFADAGLVANQWALVEPADVRPSIGIALIRLVTPFGIGAVERAVPLSPRLGDDPRGRWHVSFAARAQF
jgi:outer membrane protein assembly factor BamA